MTSRNSYFDMALIFDKLRKNAWMTTLYSVILFFAMPVFLAMRMQGISRTMIQNRENLILQYVTEFFGINNKIVFFLVIPAAIIAAANVFFYLTSRKQVDFYHSLPLKREKLFATNYVAGIILYLAPYILNLLLSVIVLAGMGYINYLNISAVITGFLLNILFYLAIYNIAIFAIMLCGHLVVSIMGTAVFLAYGPFICISYTELMRFFYKNYYQLFRMEDLLRNSSPVFDFMIANNYYTFSAYRIIVYIIITALLTIINLYLYKKRPSEAAGRAMSFKISKPIIKYPIVFISTLIFGLFFMTAGGMSRGWMVFGFICGGVISHFITEIIYNFDFKAIFNNIKGLAIFAVLFAVFISVPAFDITGYDRHLPERSEIASARIAIYNFNENSYFTNAREIMRFDYRNRDRVLLDLYTLTTPDNIDSVFNIAKAGAQNTGKDRKEFNASVGIEFELKDGSKFARRYLYLKDSEIEPHIISIFDTEEFKQKLFKLYSLDDKEVKKIAVRDIYTSNDIQKIMSIEDKYQGSGTQNQINIKDNDKIDSILYALKYDMVNLKGQYMKNNFPSMVLMLGGNGNDIKNEWISTVPIYDSFTKTISVLNSLGIQMPKMIPEDMVDYININNYEYEKYMAAEYVKERSIAYPANPTGRNDMRITEKDKISEVLKSIVPEDSIYYNPFFEKEFGYRANIVSSKYMNGYSRSFVFKKGLIPDFVKAYWNK